MQSHEIEHESDSGEEKGSDVGDCDIAQTKVYTYIDSLEPGHKGNINPVYTVCAFVLLYNSGS